MSKIFTVIALLSITFASVAQAPRVLVMDAKHLVEVKKKIAQQDKTTLTLVEELKKQANDLLKMKAVSVMDKGFTPVSGNKHDYMSQAPYFWYDSSKPNGLPYLRRDGVRNPEINKITDRTNLGVLDNASRKLALAYYLTGDEKYAAKAAELLKTWFLNEDTKMNPHLEYGQAIPGINTGRGIGIIETVALTGIADAAALLEGSQAWKVSDHKSLQDWYAKYLDWLLTSKYGKDEHAAKNNHGTWYYAQVIDFALFTGNLQAAKGLAEESKMRIDSQINNEGKMQLELDRTRGLSYSSMNLVGWTTVARLANQVGVDIWNYKNKQNASIRTAIDWLLPYALGDKTWPYQQITPYSKEQMYTLLLLAKEVYKDPAYTNHSSRVDKEVNDVMIDLLFKK